MNSVIMSDEYPIYADDLSRRGFNIIPSENIESLISYERRHADLQCLVLDDTAFVASSCERIASALEKRYKVIGCAMNISGKYPGNVALNGAVVGRYVIARMRSLDNKVIEYCRKHGYQLINVNQGYAKCSCAVVGDNALITADRGIYNSLKEYNLDVLLIEEGRVALPGAEYGFIGGASGLYTEGKNRTLYFCGDINRHPDHKAIQTFCEKHNTKVYSLCDTELTDIGGMIFC